MARSLSLWWIWRISSKTKKVCVGEKISARSVKTRKVKGITKRTRSILELGKGNIAKNTENNIDLTTKNGGNGIQRKSKLSA